MPNFYYKACPASEWRKRFIGDKKRKKKLLLTRFSEPGRKELQPHDNR